MADANEEQTQAPPDDGMRRCRECSMEYNCDVNSFCPGCGKSYETHGEIIPP